jgi:hypothetical protein
VAGAAPALPCALTFVRHVHPTRPTKPGNKSGCSPAAKIGPLPRLVSYAVSSNKTHGFAVCIRNAGFGASLEVRKLYPVVDDPDAEANDLIRVIDESGEDYVYPARLFQRLTLPVEVQRALRLAS